MQATAKSMTDRPTMSSTSDSSSKEEEIIVLLLGVKRKKRKRQQRKMRVRPIFAKKRQQASSRNSLNPGDAVPPDLLKSHDKDLVCKWLRRFLMETSKCDGLLYPPSTLRSLVSGLNRVLQVNNAPFSVLNKTDPMCPFDVSWLHVVLF